MALVERIERATLDAVSPTQMLELPGWLVPLDTGTIGRAHSAVPLQHDRADAAALPTIVRHYREAGLKPALRLPEVAPWQDAHPALQAQGWRRTQPTWVLTAEVDVLWARTRAPLPAGTRLCDDAQASAAWTDLFLGEGFDPVDGASRAQALARSTVTRFLGIAVGPDLVACGAACFSQGLGSAHGLRTRPNHRGQGLATAMLGILAERTRAQGVEQVFLQVDASNPALALYQRLGFARAWQYAYWRLAN